ncbi:protein LTO1 homolog [Haliotis cracherodii]|uniref:protein LTO1 homolog n=1 Tax=Haliotis cracherodii TaxID=6455 RepID=UPI0039ECFFF7
MASSTDHEKVSRNDDMDDLFHDVIMSEERSQGQGFREGRAEGEKRGLADGFSLGFEKGAAIGSEVGFYQGYVETLQELNTQEGTLKPRVQKSLQALAAMLSQFPVADVMNQTLFEDLERIRAKFKQVTSLLGISTSYGAQDKSKGMSF